MILIYGQVDSFDTRIDVLLRQVICQQLAALTTCEKPESVIDGIMAVVEPGDSLTDIEQVIGFDVLSDPFSGTRFGDDDFEPLFEVLEEHESCFELVIVPGDGDFGIVIFIPKVSGVDPQLLDFCQMYSNPAPSSPSGLSLPQTP
jgi:hypothetical protein